METSPPRYRARIAAASLIAGPALMSLGDLLHPAESWDGPTQAAIVAESTGRWFAAHLLLFIGLLVFVPGLLALADMVERRRPVTGYVVRLLLLISVGALSGVFGFEMLLGSVLSSGGDRAGVEVLLAAFQSRLFPALLPGLLAFFAGTGIAVLPLSAPPRRWPALCLGLGAALILGEIILAEVRLSQVGNLLILVAGFGFARTLVEARQEPALTEPA